MLESLVNYADQLGLVVEPGFAEKFVRWMVNIDSAGKVKSVTPADTIKQRARGFPCCPDLQHPELLSLPRIFRELGFDTHQAAHFLIDTCETVALYPERAVSESKSLEKHRTFVNFHVLASRTVPLLGPVATAISNPKQLAKLRSMLKNNNAKRTDSLSFSINNRYILESDEWHSWWRKFRLKAFCNESSVRRLCLVSAEPVKVARTHPKLMQLRVGTLGFGASLISFDKAAFQAYGFEQGENCAMSESAATAYRAAIDHLLRSVPIVGGMKLVYWYDATVPVKLDPLALLFRRDPRDEKPVLEQLSKMQLALELVQAKPNEPDSNTRGHVLALRGVDGRVQVRMYTSSTLKRLVTALHAWFYDTAIINVNGRCVTDTAGVPLSNCLPTHHVRRKSESEDDHTELEDPLLPFLVPLWHTAIDPSQNVPVEIVSQIVKAVQCSAFSGDFDEAITSRDPNDPLGSVLQLQIGVLKAFHIRNGDVDINSELNPEHPTVHYQAGRLAALISTIHKISHPEVNNRRNPHLVFARAISDPVNVLMEQFEPVERALKQIGGIRPAFAVQLMTLLERIWAKLNGAIPNHQSEVTCSLFVLGYYQQLAAHNSKRKTTAFDEDIHLSEAQQLEVYSSDWDDIIGVSM